MVLSRPTLPVLVPAGIPLEVHPSQSPDPGQACGARLHGGPSVVSLLKGCGVRWPKLSPKGLLLLKGFVRHTPYGITPHSITHCGFF